VNVENEDGLAGTPGLAKYGFAMRHSEANPMVIAFVPMNLLLNQRRSTSGIEFKVFYF
jgi:hypothetical protein